MSYIIDPIGALTSKPYSFVNRPWELRVAETIDFSDDYYSLLNVGVLNNKVQRVLPITRDISNGNTFSTVFGSSWVSDRSRFFFEKYFTNKREYYPFYTSGSITSGLNKYGRSSRLGWFYFVT